MPSRDPTGDTIIACDSVRFHIVSPKIVDSLQVPEWKYNWLNGSLNDTSTFYNSVWHYVEYGYSDNCRKFVDSFYVHLYSRPVTPKISVINAQNMNAILHGGCLKKATIELGDTATFIEQNIQTGYSFYWNTPNGVINGIDTIHAYTL